MRPCDLKPPTTDVDDSWESNEMCAKVYGYLKLLKNTYSNIRKKSRGNIKRHKGPNSSQATESHGKSIVTC